MALATLLVTFAAALPQGGPGDTPLRTDVFVAGEDGYHTARIPAVVRTNEGTLLAFCEGRVSGRGDAGDIDLLLRRSTDGGKSWSGLQRIAQQGKDTWGNPCPVVDRRTGTVSLLLTWNAGDVAERGVAAGFGRDSRRVYLSRSTDDGVTWSAPADITATVKEPSWTWYATGPGAGIQIEHGEHEGRLVVPCDHKGPNDAGEVEYRSHVILSDDGGETWRLGGTAPDPQVNECEVAELAGGRLLLNMRSYDKTQHTRQVCVSDDGGASWHDQRHDEALIEPVCQASLRRLRWPKGAQPGVLLFSNPASTKKRAALTVRASLDDGATWPLARVLHDGSAAYSCLVALDDDHAGCLYERDDYGAITFAVFSFDWLKGGE